MEVVNKFSHTLKIIQSIREKTGTAVLFFSAGGKDGIVLLDLLSPRFEKVICYYMYIVEDLEHINKYIYWAENNYPNVEVRKIHHYMLGIIEKNGFFCDEKEDIKTQKVGEIEAQIMADTGVPFAFSGMKGVDGFMKRMRLKMFGNYFTSDKGMVYPLALWTNKEVLQYIENKKLIKPFVYVKNALSQGFALNYSTLVYLKENHPSDYKKVINKFPYAEMVIFNYERQQIQGEPKGND